MRWNFGQKIIDIVRKNTPIIIKNLKFNLLYFFIGKNKKHIPIDKFLLNNKEVRLYIPCELDNLHGRANIFKHMYLKEIFTPSSKNIKPDFLIAFGENLTKEHIDTFLKHKDLPIYFGEEAFLRSITMHNEACDPKYEKVHAFFFDDLWFHFNCHKASRIELMLNDKKLIITEEQKKRARNIIEMLVSNKITKYNHQPIYKPSIGRPGRKKVLVIEQAYMDSSIYGAGANDRTFDLMLKQAIAENPDADIIVKTHPEQVSGRRGGLKLAYYANLKQNEQIYPINIAINPYSLLEIVDKVYVCSSMFGLEALMAGKEVHCFGLPSYAGWGLTKDYLKCPRRKNKRTLEEMIYIIYVMYATYFMEEEKIECEDLINYLIKLRQEYFDEYSIRYENS